MNRFDLSRRVLAVISPAILLGSIAHGAAAPSDSMDAARSSVESTSVAVAGAAAPVVFRGDTLFVIQARLGPFTPQERAQAIERRLRNFAEGLVRFDSVMVAESGVTSDVIVGEVVLQSVTDTDAELAGRTRQELAREQARVIGLSLHGQSFWNDLEAIALGAVFTLLATLVLVLVLNVLGKGLRRLETALSSWKGSRIRPLQFRTLEVLSADRLAELLFGVARIARLIVVLTLLYFYVPVVFSFFPWTRSLGTTWLGYISTPLRQLLQSCIGYVPNLFMIGVVGVVTHFVLRIIHLMFRAIETGTLQFRGFYRDWAEPTYKIARFLVLVFALVVVFPYLPGSGSDAFKGVSIFFGVLLSLGSSSAIANAVSGIVITYMRPFQIGDRVQIADTTGDVIERNLLITRIRTIKNVDITVPNSMVLSSHLVNFSSSAQNRGLILHTTVTIGYDAPWRKVHELLRAAANATENILQEPAPFVLQASLDDHYVRYELNAFTDKPNDMAQTYSDLHHNIQDKFNEGGVEIMSPHYTSLRDGNGTTIPADRRPADYRAPAFRILPAGVWPDAGGRK